MPISIPESVTPSRPLDLAHASARRCSGSALRILVRRALALPLGSLIVLLLITTMALLADLIAPSDPLQVMLSERLLPPVFAGGSMHHILGTDGNGRDILSRIIFGTRIDLPIAVVSLGIGAAIGSALGLVSGYAGAPWTVSSCGWRI